MSRAARSIVQCEGALASVFVIAGPLLVVAGPDLAILSRVCA
jgi:hypothetical protein